MNNFTAILIAIAAMVAGIFFSALFSGMETGIYVLNKIRLSLRSSCQDASAKHIEAALNNSGGMLASLLLATNISNYTVTVAAVMLLERLGASDIELISTAIVTPLLFVFGEMVPKNLFRQAAEVLVYSYSGALAVTLKMFRWTGLSGVLDLISRLLLKLLTRNRSLDASSALLPASVRAFLAEGHAHGALTDTQQWMAHKVMELRGTLVTSVMTPAKAVVSVSVDCTREEFTATLRDHDYSRIPLWQGSSTNVSGVVNVCRYLGDTSENASLADYASEPVWIDEDLEVSQALMILQRSRHTMGFIRDNRGNFIGIVTLKDIVEEIVGELQAW